MIRNPGETDLVHPDDIRIVRTRISSEHIINSFVILSSHSILIHTLLSFQIVVGEFIKRLRNRLRFRDVFTDVRIVETNYP